MTAQLVLPFGIGSPDEFPPAHDLWHWVRADEYAPACRTPNWSGKGGLVPELARLSAALPKVCSVCLALEAAA